MSLKLHFLAAQLLAAGLSLYASGCQFAPHANLYATDPPQKERVVGRYALTEQTITRGGLGVLQRRRCELQLHGDGSFTATNVPPNILDSPGPEFFNELVAGSGDWELAVVAYGATLDTKYWGVVFHSDTVAIHPASLSGWTPPYRLIFTIGDPDSGQVMIFERTD